MSSKFMQTNFAQHKEMPLMLGIGRSRESNNSVNVNKLQEQMSQMWIKKKETNSRSVNTNKIREQICHVSEADKTDEQIVFVSLREMLLRRGLSFVIALGF